MTTKAQSLSVFFPAYNDAPALPGLIERAFAVLSENAEDFEIVVVNDGSQDDTAAVLRELQSRFGPRLRVIEHPENRGYGAALRTGFSAAQYELVFYTDGDGQYDVAELPLLLREMTDGVGLVNGYKLRRRDPWHRVVIGWLYNKFARALFGIALRDIDCDFRLIRRDILSELNLESHTGSICLELVKKIELSGCSVAEVGVHHYVREYGRSQFFRFRSLLQTMRQILFLYWKLVIWPSLQQVRMAFKGNAKAGQPAATRARHGAYLGTAALALAMVVALVVSRWATFPRYLITFDAINFALAIEKFDVRLHQPQPPGYPVFVGLLKVLSWGTPEIEKVFLAAALLVSAITLALVWRACDLMAGRQVGIIGAGLLLFNPTFWYAALTNPVRLCLAAGAAAVALCVWLACQRNSRRWYVAAAGVLGLVAGARPSLALLMTPLMLWVALRLRLRWRAAGLAILCCGTAMATWLPFNVSAAGGPGEFVRILTDYSNTQMGGTSLLFGAELDSALYMAWRAIAWTCFGALSWLWIVPFMRRKSEGRFEKFTVPFLALWFFPGLLFYAVFHVADPDHTLAIVPATCVAGALALARWTQGFSRRKQAAAVSACVLLNIFLFFKPITKTTKAATYTPVLWLENYTANIVDGVRELQKSGPVTVVLRGEAIGWRRLSYYNPGAHLVVLQERNGDAITTWRIVKRESTSQTSDGAVPLPEHGTLAWVDPTPRQVVSNGRQIPPRSPYLSVAPAAPGESYEFCGVRFDAGNEASGDEEPGDSM